MRAEGGHQKSHPSTGKPPDRNYIPLSPFTYCPFHQQRLLGSPLPARTDINLDITSKMMSHNSPCPDHMTPSAVSHASIGVTLKGLGILILFNSPFTAACRFAKFGERFFHLFFG